MPRPVKLDRRVQRFELLGKLAKYKLTRFSLMCTHQNCELARVEFTLQRVYRRVEVREAFSLPGGLVLLVQDQGARNVELTSRQELDGRRPRHQSRAAPPPQPVHHLYEVFGGLQTKAKDITFQYVLLSD